MSEVQSVDVEFLTLDAGLQCRPHLDHSKVEEYAEGIQDGRCDPIRVVMLDDGRMVVTDGYTRIAAYQKLRIKEVPALVQKGTWEDAVLHAASANANHGVPRDNATKRAQVLLLLSQPGWENRSTKWIAETAAVSRAFVDAIRREARQEAGCQAEVIGKDGRTYQRDNRCESGSRVARHVSDTGSAGCVESSPQRVVMPEYDDSDEPETDSPVEMEAVGDNRVAAKDEVLEMPGEEEPEPEDEPSVEPQKRRQSASSEAREWASSLPLASRLSGHHLRHFLDAAALYYQMSEVRQLLGDRFRTVHRRPEPGDVVNAYSMVVQWFLTVPHPRDWQRCLASEDHGKQCACRSRGFIVGA